MIHVIASIRVKSGKRDILIEHLKSNIPNVIKEKGCIEYNSTIDMDFQIDNQAFDENMVTIIEKWENINTKEKAQFFSDSIGASKESSFYIDYFDFTVITIF